MFIHLLACITSPWVKSTEESIFSADVHYSKKEIPLGPVREIYPPVSSKISRREPEDLKGQGCNVVQCSVV